jgi:hypothetical protein
MLLAGVRRIAVICASVLAGTVAVSVLLGFAAGAGVERSISVGLYVLGTILLGGCFVFGVRGPLRGVSKTGETVPILGAHGTRRATHDERQEATHVALLLFIAGILVIVLGSLIDPTHKAF